VEEHDRISHQPQGHGLIGEMLRTGESIRLANIADHPKSVGFPEGHPVMNSFLGVPIKAYGRSIGQIYLTEKIDEPEFTAGDQRLIEMLAAHAAAAIENARLYQQVLGNESQLAERNEELGLMYSMATAVSSSMDLDRLLEVMLGRVMNIFHADAGEMFLLEESEGVYRKAIHLGGGRAIAFGLAKGLLAKWRLQVARNGRKILARMITFCAKRSWTAGMKRWSAHR